MKTDTETIITALMDLRDEWIAKQPKGEWARSERAQGVEKGIEMAIKKVREASMGAFADQKINGQVHTQIARDTAGMAKIVDNLRKCGIDEIRAELVTDGERQYYRVVYKTDDDTLCGGD